MQTPLESRITAGDPHPVDFQWLAFLDMVFADVSLSGFANHGMSPDMARRFISLIALTQRFGKAA